MPGDLIGGRYRLATAIGRGGMGVVWQARDELLNRDVAVKELLWPVYFTEEEQRAACRRAGREARLAARLNHRNVVRVFDIIDEGGRPWIVMELLSCGSLRDLLEKEGPLSSVQAARIGLEVLAALRAAHAEGIVHRDVKPANIMIGPDRVVLTDFGIARPAGMPAVTTAGMLVGSPSYTAPERARTGQSGPAGDLWGLGASLYAAVEGRGPFDRDGGALASLTAVVADEPDPSRRAGPLLWPVISALLTKDPDKRLGAAEAERMLRRAAFPPAVPAAAPRRRRVPVPAAALVGSAALAVLAASGTVAGLGLTGASPSPHATAAVAAVAPPTAGGSPAPASGSPVKTAARAHPVASPAHTPQPSPSRTTATTTNAATGNFATGNSGANTASQEQPATRTGRFAAYLTRLGPGAARRAAGPVPGHRGAQHARRGGRRRR